MKVITQGLGSKLTVVQGYGQTLVQTILTAPLVMGCAVRRWVMGEARPAWMMGSLRSVMNFGKARK